MISSREIASLILSEVYKGKKLDWAVTKSKELTKLDMRDRAFVNLLVLTALRRHGQIKKVLSKFIKKPLKRNSPVNFILKIAVAQILFLQIPDYSILDNAVEASKKYNLDKFVNAVLRNILRNKEVILGELSTIDNIPIWLKNNLINSLGEKSINLISNQIVQEPFLDIKVKKKFYKSFEWEKILEGKKIFPETIRVMNKKKVEELPHYKDGLWWVQGFAATFPVVLINEIFSKYKKNKISILDVGASPGGKSFQLIESGFQTTSLEISKTRIRKFLKNSERLNFSPKVIEEDFTTYKSEKKFDCILIDAPCSASGLIQKKPEMLVQKKDFASLVLKQKLMLTNATKLVKTGGYIIYSVCSIISDEGEEQIKEFLHNFKNYSLINNFNSIKNFGRLNNKFPSILITPEFFKEDGGIDGFFIACLRKNLKSSKCPHS